MKLFSVLYAYDLSIPSIYRQRKLVSPCSEPTYKRVTLDRKPFCAVAFRQNLQNRH